MHKLYENGDFICDCPTYREAERLAELLASAHPEHAYRVMEAEETLRVVKRILPRVIEPDGNEIE